MSYTHQNLNNYFLGFMSAHLLTDDEKKECEDARGMDSLKKKQSIYKKIKGIHERRWRSR